VILVIVTALLALAFLLTGRVTVHGAMQAIDFDLLLVLFALLIAVELLRESGWLDFAVARTTDSTQYATSTSSSMPTRRQSS